MYSEAKKRVTVLSGVIDPDYQRELDCCSTVAVGNSASENTGNALEHLFVLPHPMTRSMENYNDPVLVGLLIAPTLQE